MGGDAGEKSKQDIRLYWKRQLREAARHRRELNEAISPEDANSPEYQKGLALGKKYGPYVSKLSKIDRASQLRLKDFPMASSRRELEQDWNDWREYRRWRRNAKKRVSPPETLGSRDPLTNPNRFRYKKESQVREELAAALEDLYPRFRPKYFTLDIRLDPNSPFATFQYFIQPEWDRSKPDSNRPRYPDRYRHYVRIITGYHAYQVTNGRIYLKTEDGWRPIVQPNPRSFQLKLGPVDNSVDLDGSFDDGEPIPESVRRRGRRLWEGESTKDISFGFAESEFLIDDIFDEYEYEISQEFVALLHEHGLGHLGQYIEFPYTENGAIEIGIRWNNVHLFSEEDLDALQDVVDELDEWVARNFS